MQASAGIDSMVVFVRCRHLQASAGIDSVVVFVRCRQLQASAGIDSIVVFVRCRHPQASQNLGFCERRQPHPVRGFKILKGKKGGVGRVR